MNNFVSIYNGQVVLKVHHLIYNRIMNVQCGTDPDSEYWFRGVDVSGVAVEGFASCSPSALQWMPMIMPSGPVNIDARKYGKIEIGSTSGHVEHKKPVCDCGGIKTQSPHYDWCSLKGAIS